MNKNNQRKSKFKTKKIEHSFTGTMLTNYAGLSPIMNYLNKIELDQRLNDVFSKDIHSATKFTNAQVLMSVILASLSGVNRLKKITHFTGDLLVMILLGLKKEFNKDVISTRLKKLGQRGALKLDEFRLKLMHKNLADSRLTSITFDADSTVTTIYGSQEGAAKGFNSHKKGAKSYHPLLVFASELKLVANTWFRTGSAYTSNGICEFLKQTKAMLPSDIKHVFFRADSGFFSGVLFDLKVPVYKYACYCSDLPFNAYELHLKYIERSESETWIEQVKSQLLAAKTLTHDFHANDILWQLNVLAYNLSLMVRYEVKKFVGQEHATFRDWLILIPAKLIYSGRQYQLKLYEHYYFKQRWRRFDRQVLYV